MIQELGLPDGSTVDAVEECVQKRFHEVQNRCKKNQIVFFCGSGGGGSTPEPRDYEHYQVVLKRLRLIVNICGSWAPRKPMICIP